MGTGHGGPHETVHAPGFRANLNLLKDIDKIVDCIILFLHLVFELIFRKGYASEISLKL